MATLGSSRLQKSAPSSPKQHCFKRARVSKREPRGFFKLSAYSLKQLRLLVAQDGLLSRLYHGYKNAASVIIRPKRLPRDAKRAWQTDRN
jgi:hypothetical protein